MTWLAVLDHVALTVGTVANVVWLWRLHRRVNGHLNGDGKPPG